MRSMHSLIVPVLFCIFAAGCSKLKKTTEIAPQEPAPEAPAPIPATPTPSTPVAIIATPSPKRLAPEGTFFLLGKKSVETADGITGFKPGTEVKRQADGSFIAEGKVMTLRADEITNDLDVAARVAGLDAQRQAAIRQVAAAQAAAAAIASAPPSSSGSSSDSSDSRPMVSASAPLPPPAASSSSLGGSSALGTTHSMTRDGWLWEKNQYGEWRRVRPLR